MLEGIRKQIEAARFTALPAGALAKACNYTFAWEKLTWFLEYPRAGVEQQLGGELDAPGCNRTKKLDPHWKPAGRTEGCGDPFGGGKLSAAEACRAQLCGRGPSRIHRSPDPAPPNLPPLPGLASIRSHRPGPSLSAYAKPCACSKYPIFDSLYRDGDYDNDGTACRSSGSHETLGRTRIFEATSPRTLGPASTGSQRHAGTSALHALSALL